MDLNKKNMKNIMLLIVFAVLFYVGVQRIESVAAGFSFVVSIIESVAAGFSFVVSIVFPFLLGAAMAFILNVPMSFMEKRLFSKTKGKAKKLKRPICLVLAILFVVAILWIVLLVVIPEVASTVASLSVNIEAALIKLQRWAMDIFEDNKQIEVWIASVLLVVIPEVASTVASLSVNIEAALIKLQRWAMDIFEDNKQIEVWIASLQFDWDGIIHTAFGFLKNGAGNVLNSTMTVAKTVINSVMNFCVAFVFACYILLGIIHTAFGFLKNGAGNVLNSTMTVAKTVINSVMNFCVAFVFACYILLQKEKLAVQIRKILHAFFSKKVVTKVLDIASLSYKTFANFVTGQCCEAVILGTMFFISMSILRFPYALLVGVLIAFTSLSYKTFANFVTGQCCEAVILGTMFFISMSILRFPYALLVGVLIAFTALIPIFGAFIGCFLGTFLILVADPMKAIAFVILFLVLQQVEGNLIYPHVVGGSVGLPSIWVLVAVTVGGSLMGIVGMLVFIPICSVLYALFREMVYKRLKERGIHDI